MAFTANLPALWSWRLNGKQKRLAVKTALLKSGHSLKVINTVLNNNKKSSFNGRVATGPTRIPLERLFAQTQKLEERMNGDSHFSLDENLIGLNLEDMESDLLAALASLQKKEEDLRDAESMVVSEHTELACAKEELERREAQISFVSSKQEKLEEDLKIANLNLASQARQIDDLKLQVREKGGEISEVRSLLDVKEVELEKMRDELARKSKEAFVVDAELKLTARLLNETNAIVRKQEVEILELRKTLAEREAEMEISKTRRKVEEDKLKLAESNLEKRTIEFLLVQDELKKLAEQARNDFTQTNETMADFKRVKKLLSDVRSELVSCQQSLVSSREKMGDQEQQLVKKASSMIRTRKGWMPLPTDWLKINCDAALKGNVSAVAGVVRNDRSVLIETFVQEVPSRNPLVVEALALFEAVSLAKRRSWSNCCFESDSWIAIKAISEGKRNPNWEIDGIVFDIQTISGDFPNWIFSKISRLDNSCAHYLAQEFVKERVPPTSLANVL